jgi:methanogenic corrinoid protein MtbC1
VTDIRVIVGAPDRRTMRMEDALSGKNRSKEIAMDHIHEIKDAVINGKHKEIEDMVSRLLKDGVDPKRLIDEGMIAAMDVVGEKFANSEIFVPEMKKVIDALDSQGLRKAIKVMVGGAPVDKKFADAIGADGYGADAAEAVRLARALL